MKTVLLPQLFRHSYSKSAARAGSRTGRFLKPGLFCIIFLCGVVSLFADPAEGYWISVDDKTGRVTAGWHVYEEAGVLYGRILSIADFPQDTPALSCKESYPDFPLPGKVNEMRVVGTIWLYGLEKEREGRWSGGRLVDPNNGNLYGCRVTFHAAGGRYRTDTLEVRGTVGPFGASQFWRKSSREEASALH
ncbi:MAG: DUF2147 domain-containing protein [Spirochaetaceae bacterium]|jgi:uncharacterized protein (DUF2147 family)|nr:DUF2147 domain-containing protein [Spirochaetaceae bacterium]